jgi:predicted  nucleic acid-binding Zn-ribbon protein
MIRIGPFVVALLLCAGLQADELSEARAALEKAGVRASSAGVVLAKEAELSKELARSTTLRRNVVQAEKDLKVAEAQVEALQRRLTELKQQHVQLSAQLANINRNDVTLNNKLVGALQAVEGQHELTRDQKARLDEQVKTCRGKATDAREAYIELALTARRIADEIESDYAAKGADANVKEALARFNQAAKKQFTLTATTSYLATYAD